MLDSEKNPVGRIRQFLTDDHRRLDALLARAATCSSDRELAAYDEFRRGLLKHIGIEEKILLAAAQRLLGRPLAQAERLRQDHGALVALLMPLPAPNVVRAIKAILAAHNPVEEGPDGVYDICERLAKSEADDLLASIWNAPGIPNPPQYNEPEDSGRGAPRNGARRLRPITARRLLSSAQYDWRAQ